MGLFNSKPKQQLKNINGYIINELDGTLIDVPRGLQVYIIPKEVKRLDPSLNLVSDKVVGALNSAEQVIFEDGGIEKLPDRYFTFLPSSKVKKITLPSGIKYLGDDCIDPNVEFNLPESTEHLGNNAYPNVQNLIIRNNIKSLGNSLADTNLNLIRVEVAGSVKTLPNCFVNKCHNLKTLILHEGVENASSEYTFSRLNSLEYVELPDSFKVPFKSYLGDRGSTDKKRNITYDPKNKELNQILTIKKTHNGISYTFKVPRGDFGEISFNNTTAFIKPNNSQYGNISIDLAKLNPNAIFQVNIQESKIEQIAIHQNQPQPVQQQPVQNQRPIQQRPIQQQVPIQPSNTSPRPTQQVNPQPQPRPIQNPIPVQPINVPPQPIQPQTPIQPINQSQQPSPKPVLPTDIDPLDAGYTDAEINQQIKEIFEEYIYQFSEFKGLDIKVKSAINMTLPMVLGQKLKTMKKGQKLDFSQIEFMFDKQVKKMNEAQVKRTFDPLEELAKQQKIMAESQVVPVQASSSNQEDIERLKNMKQQILNNQAVMEEDIEQDHGMSM